MPYVQNLTSSSVMNGKSFLNELQLQIPVQYRNFPAGNSSTSSNGFLSPTSDEPLSPPILDTTQKKPPKAPMVRPILPMKKSRTLPIHTEEKLPVNSPLTIQNGKKLYVAKPLKDIQTVSQSSEDHNFIVTRSPSPSYRRSLSSAIVETGSIAELAKRHGSYNTLVSRSPSPSSSQYSSIKSSTSQYSTCSSNGTFIPLSRSSSMNTTIRNRTPTPRRLYPQSCDNGDAMDLKELRSKEQAPVVFDANLSFVLGCNKQPVRQNFKPVAAHLEEGTSSNYLSAKIDSFLKRTDHVMDEWRRLGHKDEPDLEMYYNGKKRKVGRSKSATNIMIKGFTLFSRSGSRGNSICRSRGISEDRTTVSEMDELSEVGSELTEERAAAALATERADAEAAERLRVERDNRDLITNNQRLQQASERLELELLHWRSAETGGAEPSDSEGSEAETGGGEKYKRRFERAHRELQLIRAQLRRQHEDDLEQLVTVKKQLEKKVQDAYEEVEEQRAVAAQWKRKLQKLTNDMADLRSLLDEQTCRNNLLEKRQRKFDAELHGAQEELKRERAAKDRLSREREQALAEKYALEQNLSEARLELELKEERLNAASRELEERGGGDETGALRRAKAELERRARDQEEELDDLAGQIQLLESSKLRLEMLLEQQRKEARLEAAARDDEMEETRANAAKKLKMLESQLESEHAERSLLLRERLELERRLASLEETARAETQEQAQLVQRLKRDLKRYRALLRDAQTMLEQKEKEGGGKAQIRQLKNQVEDLELAVRAATKAKQTAEAEASEALAALEEATRARNEAAERAVAATREAGAARAQLDDAEEEAAELLKKYRASTSAVLSAQAEAREASAHADGAAEEARVARERVAELTSRLAHLEAGHSATHTDAQRRLQLRNKELESSLELEATARSRLEGQLSRVREAHEQLSNELIAAKQREQQTVDELRKITRQLRELREENSSLNCKLSESSRAKAAAEAAAAAAVSEAAAAREEARLAARRATALQEAIAGDLSSPHDSRDTDSDNDSYSSDESIGTFLTNHKLSPTAPSRITVQLDSNKLQSSEGRQSRSSNSTSKPASPTKDSYA